MRWIFFLLAMPLFAQEPPEDPFPKAETQNWTFHKHFGVGYRYDDQKFQQHSPQESIHIAPRHTVQLLSAAVLRWRQIYLMSQMSYGWLVDGNLLLNPATGPLPKYDLGAGYTADAQAQAGIRFSLVHQPAVGFYFIPSGGYKYSHLMDDPNGAQKNNPTPSTLVIGRFTHPNQQDWFGPYLDLRLKFRWKDVFEGDLYYQYMKPSLRYVYQTELEEYRFSSGALSQLNVLETHAVVHGNALRSQVGGLLLKYQTEEGWAFSLHTEAFSCWSDTSKTIGSTKNTQYNIAAQVSEDNNAFERATKVSWKQIQASLFLGYRF